MIEIEGFRGQLQQRTETIYQKMDQLVDESDAPGSVRALKLKRPEKVALAAAEIFQGDTLGVSRSKFEIQEEIMRREELVFDSKAYRSGKEKIGKLIKEILGN